MYGLRNSELSTCLFQFSHKTRQKILLYAYFTPKVDFKSKFNHHQSFLYEWRLTARMIRKFRIGPSIRIESRIGRTIRNRIKSRSFAGPYEKVYHKTADLRREFTFLLMRPLTGPTSRETTKPTTLTMSGIMTMNFSKHKQNCTVTQTPIIYQPFGMALRPPLVASLQTMSPVRTANRQSGKLINA